MQSITTGVNGKSVFASLTTGENKTTVRIRVGTDYNKKGSLVDVFASFRLPLAVSSMTECVSALEKMPDQSTVSVSLPKSSTADYTFAIRSVYAPKSLAKALREVFGLEESKPTEEKKSKGRKDKPAPEVTETIAANSPV